jgi:hypothetical protein
LANGTKDYELGIRLLDLMAEAADCMAQV